MLFTEILNLNFHLSSHFAGKFSISVFPIFIYDQNNLSYNNFREHFVLINNILPSYQVGRWRQGVLKVENEFRSLRSTVDMCIPWRLLNTTVLTLLCVWSLRDLRLHWNRRRVREWKVYMSLQLAIFRFRVLMTFNLSKEKLQMFI